MGLVLPDVKRDVMDKVRTFLRVMTTNDHS
jgi:hypothetical protein